MGTWSPGIPGNDTSCAVRNRFFELYDKGETLENIVDIVLKEHRGDLEADPANVRLGPALACRECKTLAPEFLANIMDLVASGKIIAFEKGLIVGRLGKPRKELLDHTSCDFFPVGTFPTPEAIVSELERRTGEVEPFGLSDITLERLLELVS